MGEGVSPSLSQDGFPVANHLVVSDSGSCVHGLQGGFNQLVFQTEVKYSLKVGLIGSDGHEGLTTRGSPLQKRVPPFSLPQKEYVDVGCLLPHCGVAIAGAASFTAAKVADAVAVFDAVATVAIYVADGDSVALALSPDLQGTMFSVPVRSEMSHRRTPSRLVGREIPQSRCRQMVLRVCSRVGLHRQIRSWAILEAVFSI